ncbi:MAG: exodeoxyribonuclease VII small subunit [Planctomycetaceae bacterium]
MSAKTPRPEPQAGQSDQSGQPVQAGQAGQSAQTAEGQRTFEQAIAEVEDIVGRLEGGKLELAQSLDEYQRGIGTLKECYALLDSAERRITMLCGFDADGNAVTEPFEEPALSAQEKQAARSTRRSAAKPRQNFLLPEIATSDVYDGEDSRDGLF